MAKILLLEDDENLSVRVSDWLAAQMHTIDAVTSVGEADLRLSLSEYELLIVDWQLPDGSGLDFITRLRESGFHTPILMVTGKTEIKERETGLDAGADDYLPKPFHLSELSARVRALLRRPAMYKGSVFAYGSFVLDVAAHCVTIDGKEIKLMPKEFRLLEFLVRHPGQLFSTEALLTRVWSTESESTVETVYAHLKSLRRVFKNAIGDSPIVNVHGVGYKFDTARFSGHNATED